MYRGAIIGLGNVALKGHLPAWKNHPEFQIVAGIDSAQQQWPEYRKLFPESECYPTLEQCEQLPLDFIDICTPPHTHFPIIKEALKRKLNVLCEKPLMLSEKDFQSVQPSVRESQKILFTVHNWQYAPLCRKIRQLVQEGAIGEIKHCAWYVLRDGPAQTTTQDNWRLDPQRSGGGILIDHGWHAFYLILGWFQKSPKRVQATLENRQYADLPVEDTAIVKVEFDGTNGSNPTAEIFLTWASRVRRNWGVVQGETGSIQIEDHYLKVTKKINGDQESVETHTFEQPLSQGSHHPEWFQSVADEFLDELKNSGSRGKNLAVAQDCLKLIERSKESHRKGASVPF